jgi:hypothetical protein
MKCAEEIFRLNYLWFQVTLLSRILNLLVALTLHPLEVCLVSFLPFFLFSFFFFFLNFFSPHHFGLFRTHRLFCIELGGSVAVSGKGGNVDSIVWEDFEEDYQDGGACDNLINPEKYSAQTKTMLRRIDEHKINYDLIVALLRYIENSEYSSVPGAILIFLPGMMEIRQLHDAIQADRYLQNPSKYQVIPLHSVLSSTDQASGAYKISSDGRVARN